MTTGLTTVALSGVVLLGGVVLAGDADAAMAADGCDRDWSVSYPDGSPITSTALFSDELIAPGGSLDGAFLVTTGRDIRGPLELSAERTDRSSRLDAATESEILVTLTGSSRAVTVPLSTLLDASEPTRVVDALTAGAHDIGVTVQLPFESENTSQLQELPFQLVVTVSDSTTVVGAAPDPCTADPGGDPSAGGATGGGDPSSLASTGAQAGASVAVAAALLGAGFAAVFAARRRRRTTARH